MAVSRSDCGEPVHVELRCAHDHRVFEVEETKSAALLARQAGVQAGYEAANRTDVRTLFVLIRVEPMTGIEPAYSAWEADVLPLNYIGLVVSEG